MLVKPMYDELYKGDLFERVAISARRSHNEFTYKHIQLENRHVMLI